VSQVRAQLDRLGAIFSILREPPPARAGAPAQCGSIPSDRQAPEWVARLLVRPLSWWVSVHSSCRGPCLAARSRRYESACAKMMIAAGLRLGSTSSPLRRSQRGPTDPGASVLVFGIGSLLLSVGIPGPAGGRNTCRALLELCSES
jgi:hypothetical protein